MSTGLFHTRKARVTVRARWAPASRPQQNSFSQHNALKRAARAAKIDNLADLISEGVSIREAAKLLGIAGSTATSMMDEMRAGLGWQAA